MESAALVPITSAPLSGDIDFSFDTISDQIVQKVERCVYDLRTRRLGVLRAAKDAYAVYVPGEHKNDKARLLVCPVAAFGLPVPAYAISTPIDQLKAGDLVNVGGKGAENWMYYLEEAKENEFFDNASLVGIRIEDGAQTKVTLSENLFVGKNSVLCVKNMMGTQGESANWLPMLALLGAGGKEEGKDKLSKLLPFLLMGQGGFLGGHGGGSAGQGLDMQSLLPFLLLGGTGGGGSDKLLPLLLLQGVADRGQPV